MAVKEFREFFLRLKSVTTGSKVDQETDFPETYKVKGVSRSNRLLAGSYPSASILAKLLESITFKLNPEDRASTTVAGLVRRTTDAKAEARTANPTTDDFVDSVVAHQLPEIVLVTDGSDASVTTPVEAGGLKLTLIKRTLGSVFRRNFKIEANVANSVEINSSSKKIQLVNDLLAPTASYYYGTDNSGAKGWFGLPGNLSVDYYLSSDFSKTNNTLDVINDGGGNSFSAPLAGGTVYHFEAVLFLSCKPAGGIKVGLIANGGLTYTQMIYGVNYTQSVLGGSLVVQGEKTDLVSTIVGNGEDGVIKINGTIRVNVAGNLRFMFAQNTTDATASKILKGSYLTTTLIRI